MWNRYTRIIAPILNIVLVVSFCGCSAGSGAQPVNLIQVKGKVSYKGRPITKGSVRFEPEGYGRIARGELQSDGSFVLTTTSDGDGVVAGAHRVVVIASDKSIASDRAFRKYNSPNTSELTAEVDQEHTEFSFDLK
jgi:hypothetical protein